MKLSGYYMMKLMVELMIFHCHLYLSHPFHHHCWTADYHTFVSSSSVSYPFYCSGFAYFGSELLWLLHPPQPHFQGHHTTVYGWGRRQTF